MVRISIPKIWIFKILRCLVGEKSGFLKIQRKSRFDLILLNQKSYSDLDFSIFLLIFSQLSEFRKNLEMEVWLKSQFQKIPISEILPCQTQPWVLSDPVKKRLDHNVLCITIKEAKDNCAEREIS